jgi:bacillopeptidase F
MLNDMAAASSRLIRKEKNKIIKQTMLFGGLAVALIIVFIFIILPLFIVILNKVINTNPFPEEQKLELQVPMLNAPVVATNSAQLQISGFAQTGSTVVLLHNAEEAGSASVLDDGAFILPVTLDDGDNTLAVLSRDESGAESNVSQEFLVLFDSDAPKIIVDEPQPEKHFDRKSRVITLRGLTDPGASVYINDRLVIAGQDGTFVTSVSLQDNKNDIRVVAVDTAGNRSEQVIPVYLDV